MEENLTQQPQSTSQLPNQNQKNTKPRIWIYIFAGLVLAAIAFIGAYYWQNSKKAEFAAKLDSANSKIDQLESELEQAKQTKPVSQQQDTQTIPVALDVNPGLIPGDVVNTESGATISAIFKHSLEPTALWVEFGHDPNKLDKSSSKITQELGLGTSDQEYAAGRTITINNSELQPGGVIYYRVAATINGQTQRGAVASFVTIK